MKSLRLVALSAFLTIGAASAVFYSSCSKDACKDVVCNNGGTCSGGSCTCPTGYTGTNCDTKTFIGTWSGTDVCNPGNSSYNITLTMASSSDSTKVLISNLGGFGASTSATGTLSNNATVVTYTNQVLGAVTLSGVLTLTSKTSFTNTYTATDSTSIVTCNGTYTKQ